MKASGSSKKNTNRKLSRWQIIVGILAICVILGMCSGGGKNDGKTAADVAKQEEAEKVVEAEETTDGSEDSTEVVESQNNAIDYGNSFIDRYNSSCRTEQLQPIETFIPHDRGNEEDGWNYHYRTEFRLDEYEDALGVACSIGEYLGTDSTLFRSVDVVYWPNKPHYRVYILDNSGDFATAFIDTIKLLHPTAFSDEFLAELEEAIRNGGSDYDINKMIQDENFSMYGLIIYEDESSGIVEGDL